MRSPFLDPDFFRWAFAQPIAQKLSRRGGKAILKRAMEAFLSHDLLYRTKQGFTVPLAKWFRNELRGDIERLAESPQAEGKRRSESQDRGADGAGAQQRPAGSFKSVVAGLGF